MEQTQAGETLQFQAEVQQLLHLVVHSLYSEKEIFLRELISNASDACDRFRFEALTSTALAAEAAEPEIRVSVDKTARTLTIADNGIGMTREEVIENIGTIARSGTRRFLEGLTGDQKKDANLIGQFGVGFYSAFMVAENVDVLTRRAGLPADQAVRWASGGAGAYTVESANKDGHGTQITLRLREGEDEFLEPARLRTIIARYSDNVSIPIRMAEGEDWETVNRASALWTRPRKEVSEEEYNTFYSNISFDHEPPLLTVHNHVEGKLEYTTLFFVPSHAPFDMWDREHRHGIKLYVRRVFIADDTKYLMPPYLRFVRGIVDSNDLPLNVSREFLQHNREIDTIRAASVKRLLGELTKLAGADGEKYARFWKEFGRVLKEGVIEDADNRETLAPLLRFASTHGGDGEQVTSLDDYVGRMGEDQKAIYYLTGENAAAVQTSPQLEIFRKHGIEVLLLSDPVDEWVVSHLTTYAEKPLKSVARGALAADELPGEAPPADAGDLEPMLARMREALAGRAKDVRLSTRLTDSPACLVSDEHDMGANLERILAAMGQGHQAALPILEINPGHAFVQRLRDCPQGLEDWAHVLFDQATLSEGANLAEPAAYVRRVQRLLAGTAGD